jgi:hypothetical protein
MANETPWVVIFLMLFEVAFFCKSSLAVLTNWMIVAGCLVLSQSLLIHKQLLAVAAPFMIPLLVHVEVLSIAKESTTEMALRMIFGPVLFHPLLKFEPAITNTALRMSATIGDMLIESSPVDEIPSTRTAVEMGLAVLKMLAQREPVNKFPVAFAAKCMHILFLITFLRLIAGTAIIPIHRCS